MSVYSSEPSHPECMVVCTEQTHGEIIGTNQSYHHESQHQSSHEEKPRNTNSNRNSKTKKCDVPLRYTATPQSMHEHQFRGLSILLLVNSHDHRVLATSSNLKEQPGEEMDEITMSRWRNLVILQVSDKLCRAPRD